MKKGYTDKDIKATKDIAGVLIENKKLNKKLSRLEYFLLGGTPFNEALSAIYNMRLSGSITDREYYALNEYITFQKHVSVYHNKESILATRFIFSGKEISNLEKSVIWDELIDSGVDEKNIDDIVFSAAVRAYAIKNGYIKKLNNNLSLTKSLKK